MSSSASGGRDHFSAAHGKDTSCCGICVACDGSGCQVSKLLFILKQKARRAKKPPFTNVQTMLASKKTRTQTYGLLLLQQFGVAKQLGRYINIVAPVLVCFLLFATMPVCLSAGE